MVSPTASFSPLAIFSHEKNVLGTKHNNRRHFHVNRDLKIRARSRFSPALVGLAAFRNKQIHDAVDRISIEAFAAV
jgi:hypothetical protein